MTVLTPERHFTVDDLMTLPDASHCELVDGKLVEKNMGAEADWTGAQLITRLSNHVMGTNKGWVFGAETGYACFAGDLNRVRKPDVSFITRARLPRPPKGYIPIVPELAVEVVSPKDLYSEVQSKVDEYLAAGVLLVWVVDPETLSVAIYDQSGAVRRLRAPEVLTGEDILPGFRCEVADLFLPAEPTEVSEDRE
jgi:Uma2 family endonuclease